MHLVHCLAGSHGEVTLWQVRDPQIIPHQLNPPLETAWVFSQLSKMGSCRVPTGKEGRKKLIPGSQIYRMDGVASVCRQHDILPRQAMMFLLTIGWFLAHTSLAMTPEQSATSGQNSPRRSARERHSRSLEQGTLARPAIPRLHLRCCTFCDTQALGDERNFAFRLPAT